MSILDLRVWPGIEIVVSAQGAGRFTVEGQAAPSPHHSHHPEMPIMPRPLLLSTTRVSGSDSLRRTYLKQVAEHSVRGHGPDHVAACLLESGAIRAAEGRQKILEEGRETRLCVCKCRQGGHGVYSGGGDQNG